MKTTKEMQLVDINKLIPYINNSRKHSSKQIVKLRSSLREFGFINPVIIDKDYNVIAGHGRIEAAKAEGISEVPCVLVDYLTEAQKKAYIIADNKMALDAEWDEEMLKIELEALKEEDFDLKLTGFDNLELNDIFQEKSKYTNYEKGSIIKKYVVAPISVIDCNTGTYQDRKNQWLKYIHSDDGRQKTLIGKGYAGLAKKSGKKNMSYGTSVFDPVLTEVLLAWFCPEDGKVIDPFSGGSVRGLVSSFTGRHYTGVDLRQEQIDANEVNYEEIKDIKDFYENKLEHPTWLCGDSTQITDIVQDRDFDFMLTCPPYADIEKYSDDPKDLSNMEYSKFIETFRDIIVKTTSLLKENSYAVCVVGEVRDKKGNYYNFVSDTIKAFLDAGLKYYNEIILKTATGTAGLRVNVTFGTNRKVVKTHQNVLVFVKGDPKQIHLEEYKYEFPEDKEE